MYTKNNYNSWKGMASSALAIYKAAKDKIYQD